MSGQKYHHIKLMMRKINFFSFHQYSALIWKNRKPQKSCLIWQIYLVFLHFSASSNNRQNFMQNSGFSIFKFNNQKITDAFTSSFC